MATILVVDDSPDNNEMLCRLLRTCGHRAVAAFSGEGALALLGTERPQLVILDVMMPGMDGLEVLRLIRSNAATATLPVVLFSAVADQHYADHARRKGANDFWVKGAVDMSKLDEMIARYLLSAA